SNGQCFELVRADGKTAAACHENLKRITDARKGKGSVGEMFGIMRDKILKQLLKLIWRQDTPLGVEATCDHQPGASAHKIPCLLVGQRGKPFLRENHIQCVDEIRGCIDKRAIEVKNNGGRGHGTIASFRSALLQGRFTL